MAGMSVCLAGVSVPVHQGGGGGCRLEVRGVCNVWGPAMQREEGAEEGPKPRCHRKS